ncbi:conjugal transfer protein TraF [Photobacterium leiognathi]|uniref:conjugal transfer protein TraF n=1 Tax=Photobacterium leiognathi TaxID=553611 RepID=UPI00298114F9|nr:conjugal transfer protein TraF [Photobacterium leiognathi]
MFKLKKLSAVSIILLSTSSTAAFAFNGADARGMAMGGTGVASANYLAAGFYNPALATNYTDNDDFGLMLPSVSVSAHDADDLYHKIDHFQEVDSRIFPENDWEEREPTDADKQEWKDALMALDNGQIQLDVQAGIALSIPNRYASATVFTKAQLSALVMSDIHPDDLKDENWNNDEYKMQSTAEGLAGGTADLGIAIAKSFDLPFKDQKVSVGFSPKIQKIYALKYKDTVDSFEDSEFDAGNEHTEKTAFNLDLGVTYQPIEKVTLALAAQNVMKQELETNVSFKKSATYLVEPKYTAGVAYDDGMFTLAADIDLNKQHYFKGLDYATQFVHLGAEFNAWDWAQLRAGYSMSMTDYAKNMVTAGIGFKPFGAFGIDLAGQYGEDNNYGASLQFVLTI